MTDSPSAEAEYSIDKLIHAVQWGDAEFVEAAIEDHGYSPDAHDKDQCSLLHWAAINNRTEIARYLIRKNANVNVVGGDNREIPLQWAVRNPKSVALLHLLIGEGSNMHHKSIYGYDALFIAVQKNHINLAFLLLNAGADPDTVGGLGDTPAYFLLRKSIKENDPTVIEMLRLLLAYNASLTFKAKGGDNAMHILAYAKSCDTNLAILVYEAGGREMLDAVNHENLTPYQVVMKAQRHKMALFMYEAYLYTQFPSYLPIFTSAAMLCFFFVALEALGWLYGALVFFPALWCAGFLLQPLVPPAASRSVCGISWGIIASIVGSYCYYLSGYYGSFVHYTFACCAVGTSVSLFNCTRTNPAYQTSGSTEKRNRLVSRLVEQSLAEASNPNSSYDAMAQFRLCTTCVTDKSEVSMHCSKCNKCIISLDHHCPFVCNCVGSGNRRVFVLFTAFASVGCGYFASLAFNFEHLVLCPDAPTVWTRFFHVQWCAFWQLPALTLVGWMAAMSALSIGGLVFSQLTMVMGETTTHEILKRGNGGRYPLTCRGVMKVVDFCGTGVYTVAPKRPDGDGGGGSDCSSQDGDDADDGSNSGSSSEVDVERGMHRNANDENQRLLSLAFDGGQKATRSNGGV